MPSQDQPSGPSAESMRMKLERLGFVPRGLGMALWLGQVEIDTAEGPFGLVIYFTSITKRTMTQYHVTTPYICSSDQIAKLIFVNMAQNFNDNLADCSAHFRNLGVSGYQ